jgi:superfamily II DNA helicase RecQ
MSCGGVLRLLEDAELIDRSEQAEGEGATRSRRRVLEIRERAITPQELKRRLAPLLAASADRRTRGLERVAAVERYAWGRGCRHRALLRYFGDELDGSCAACDACCDWKPKVQAGSASPGRTRKQGSSAVARMPPGMDAAKAQGLALVAVAAVHRRFGLTIARQILRGSRAKKVLGAGLERCAAYGSLARLSDGQVDEVLRTLESEGLVESAGGPRPVILVTEEGRLRLEDVGRSANVD